MFSVGRAGPGQYRDIEEGGFNMFDRLKKDLGIRAILAIIMLCSLIAMIFTGNNPPEAYLTLVGMAIAYYFSNRSTMDKPQ